MRRNIRRNIHSKSETPEPREEIRGEVMQGRRLLGATKICHPTPHSYTPYTVIWCYSSSLAVNVSFWASSSLIKRYPGGLPRSANEENREIVTALYAGKKLIPPGW